MFDRQHTDWQNSQPVPTASKPGDDLKSTDMGSTQEIASRDYRGQQHTTGNGGDAVTATRK